MEQGLRLREIIVLIFEINNDFSGVSGGQLKCMVIGSAILLGTVWQIVITMRSDEVRIGELE